MSNIPAKIDSNSDERLMALLAHLSFLVIAVIGPLILMLVKKDSPFVEDQSKEALNFQLAMFVISFATCGIGAMVCVPMLFIFGIIGGLEAQKGVVYRYPYTFRLVK